MESKRDGMVKFADFEQNPNLVNVTLNLVGIISKIGELKYANQGNVNEEIVPIRDLQLYDDTFTIVRLILRDHLAENCNHLKVDDILSLKNVKIQKVHNRFVMITLEDTKIDVNLDAYHVLWLKQWFLHNRTDLLKNNFTQFNNLSNTPAKPKREREKTITSSPISRESVSSPAKLPRQSPSNIINTLQNIDQSGKADFSLSSPSSPMNLKSDFVCDNNSSPQSPEDTSNGLIEIESDDSGVKPNIQKEKKKESREKEGAELRKENEEIDKTKKEKTIAKEINEDININVRFETYNTLMHSSFLENEWDEDKDYALVYFIIQNTCDLQNDLVYSKILIENPEVFGKKTPAMLKERVFMLSSVKNYLYLMKLCGGDNLTTEKEKCTFIAKLEKLRDSMKLIKTSP